ncbi:MAG: T9SS type A sorting domain-containing protein [Bacteroidia bacterium]
MKARFILFFSLTTLSFNSLFATHFMGVQMTYECIGTCTYRFHHKAYYDCSGGATTLPPGQTEQPVFSFVTVPSGCGLNPQIIGSWVFVQNTEVTPICPQLLSSTSCNGGGILNGVTEGYYYVDYNLCNGGGAGCNSVKVSYSICCRNGAITSGSANEGFYQEMLIDLSSSVCNQSPVFNQPPISYICTGEPIILDQGAVDPDGDSLVYSLGPCYDGPGVIVPYNPGYDYLQPMGTGWNVHLDSLTGFLSLTPNPSGGLEVGVICINLDEYRNGQFMGRLTRDVQVTVLDCQNSSPVTLSGIQNLAGGILDSPDKIRACAGTNLNFDIVASDVNPMDSLTFLSNISGLLPNVGVNIVGNNPATFQVSWMPGIQDIGKIYAVSFSVSDNECLISSTDAKTIFIEVANTCIAYQTFPSNCNDSTGGIDITLFNVVPPVQYLWSNGDTTEDLSGIPTGIYWVYATDSTGTVFTDTFWVDAKDISILSTLIQPDCDSITGSVITNISGGTPPYTFTWSNGDTTSSLVNIPAGGYTLYIFDSGNCVKHETFILEEPDSCFVSVSGKAYLDLNGNCVFDSTDYPLVNAFIDFNPGGGVFTDSSGNYSFICNTGTVSVSYTNTAHPPALCSPGNTQTLILNSTDDDTTGIDFPIDTVIIQDLKINGFVGGNLVPGNPHYYLIHYSNTGTIPMDGTVSLFLDSAVTYVSSSPAGSYDPSTSTVTWSFSDLSPGQNKTILVQGFLPAVVPVISSITTSVAIYPIAGDFTPGNNTKTWSQPTFAPYDPNDKQVFPAGIGTEGFIQVTDSVLEYTIRFQNTGTFSANYVIIKDLIDDNLDISTFSPGVFSHPYSVTAELDKQLVFTFANINLPDSASDPEGSKGFIQFSLKQRPNLPIGTRIKNSAAIIFDFNEPVITNEVVNTIFNYPEVEIIEPADSLCPEDLLTAQLLIPAMPPYEYEWKPTGSISNSFDVEDMDEVNQSGWYYLTVTDSFGFSDTDSVYVPVKFNPVSDFSFEAQELEVNFTNLSQYGKTWLWDFGDGNEASEIHPDHRFSKSGTYQIQLVTTNECQSDTIIREIDVYSGNRGDNFIQSVRIAPNPFSESLVISFYNPDLFPVELNMIDARGRLVVHYEPEQTESFTINNSGFAAGIYFIELIGTERFLGKVMVR